MPRMFLTLLAVVAFTAAGWSAPVPKGIKARGKAPPRAKIEPLPGGKLYTVDWDDKPFDKAMDELERLTGLLFLSKEQPKLRITFRTSEKVCVSELFAQINDGLYAEGYILARKTQSFAVVKRDAPLDRTFASVVTRDVLERKTPDEPVQMVIPAFDEEGVAHAMKATKDITHKWFEATKFGSDKLLVVGRAAEVQRFVDDTEELFKEREAVVRAKDVQRELELFGGPRPVRRPLFR